MTYDPMDRLKEFHDKFDPEGESRLYDRDFTDLVNILNKRINLIVEEFHEVDEALGDLIIDIENPERWHHVSKELADLLYVVYGTAEELQIPLPEIFEEVHKSNMSKVWRDGTVHYRDDGKILKPPTYTEANIKRVWDEYYP